jgi:hypothetical protein
MFFTGEKSGVFKKNHEKQASGPEGIRTHDRPVMSRAL